jgi:neurotransmitter:Na+ symporter, NSS family
MMKGPLSKQQAAEKATDQFSSTGFIMAAIGSSVGLGNMWKFPYITGENGGAAFFLLFIVCLIIVGMPILLAELAVGRGGRGSASSSFRNLSKVKAWSGFGILSVIGAFMILSFYSVVAGWTLHYAYLAFSGQLFTNSDFEGTFIGLNSGWLPLLWHFIVMGICLWVVARGISGGIEKFNKYLIPLLLIILLVLMGRALTLQGAMEGVRFFLQPDFSKLNAQSALVALGHAFFSLSLGMGTMLTYGAYVQKEQSLGKAAAAVGVGDLGYAFIAGLIIFPTSFAFGLDPAQGPGLVFMVLPAAFSAMPLGSLFGGLFFILLAIAALTSAVSLLEVPVAFSMERWKWNRVKATVVSAVSVFIVGIPAALSIAGPLSNWTYAGRTFFDWLDFIASNILLPFGGLVVTLFVGYAWKKSGEETGLTGFMLKSWMFLIRYVAPVMVVFVFLYSVGLFG